MSITLVECPRDALQGLDRLVPTAEKIAYLNQLLRVGFSTLDFGSFVSPKAVPQMADTAEVLAGLDLTGTDTDLLAIVANRRGAETAVGYPEIRYLGYPFSVSETFQQRNTRKSLAQSRTLVGEMQELCEGSGKELVVYLSMAFGNPYGDLWSPDLVGDWLATLADYGVKTFALADTVGTANPEQIRRLFGTLMPAHPTLTLGAHFHSTPTTRREKIAAAYESGVRRFDTALLGYGGCPFAKDELVGNIATESLLAYFAERGEPLALDEAALGAAMATATEVFGK